MAVKKISFVLAVLMVLSVELVWARGGGESGSSGGGRKAVITFWHTNTGASPYAVVFNEEFDKFKKNNPDIIFDVDEVNSAMDSMGTRITTALAANDLPDIYTFWGGFTIIEPVSRGLLMDVNEYLKITKDFKYEEISSAAWDWYRLDGVLRGFPTQGYYPAWFCNKELFGKYGLQLPKTMKDVAEAAKVFAQNGIIPIAVGSSGGNPGHFLVSDLAHQYTGGTKEILDFGKSNKFDTPNSVKAAQVILDLRAAGAFPKDTVANGDWTPSFELYNNGMAAMLYSYSWAYANMSDEMWNKSVLIDAPVVDGGSVSPNTFVQSSANYGLCVSQKAWGNPDKQANIVRFLDWYLSDAQVQKMADSGLVHVKTTLISYNDKKMKLVDTFYSGRTKVPGHFNTTSNRDGWTTFLSSCDELFAGSISARDFAAKIQKAYDENTKR
jgi:ABC-type glycerol-3-phosphate transport system substrate-binding protein